MNNAFDTFKESFIDMVSRYQLPVSIDHKELKACYANRLTVEDTYNLYADLYCHSFDTFKEAITYYTKYAQLLEKI